MTRKSGGAKKRPFSDVFKKYKTYDTSQGFGSVGEWQAQWEQMSGAEAVIVLQGRLPHEILGLSLEQARDLDCVKRAMRQIVMENHPDKNPGNKEAEQRCRDALAAYAKLSGRP